MKLKASGGGDFTPHPESEGLIHGVIVDITEPKKVETKFGPKEKFRLVFETEMKREDGSRFCVWSQGYSASLNEKATFRKDLRKILGRDLTAQELEEFDTESLLHVPVQMIVVHADGEDGRTFANIAHIQPDKSGTPLRPSGNFTRGKDREGAGGAGQGEKAGYRRAEQDSDAGREDWQRCKVHVGKNQGVDLGDLDQTAVQKLIEIWLPKHKANAKPTADDKRLASALAEAEKVLAAATAQESDF